MLRVIIITEERILTTSQSIAGVEITCNNPAHTRAPLLYKPLPAESKPITLELTDFYVFMGKFESQKKFLQNLYGKLKF